MGPKEFRTYVKAGLGTDVPSMGVRTTTQNIGMKLIHLLILGMAYEFLSPYNLNWN